MHKHTSWLNENAAAIQAGAAVGAVLLALVLAVITYEYVRLTRGLLDEARRERRERLFLIESDQARKIGGFIEFADDIDAGRAGNIMVRLRLVNGSLLPVRAVKGTVYSIVGNHLVGEFDSVPVLAPGSDTVLLETPENSNDLRLELEYDDDAGARWKKYGTSNPLERLT